MLISLLLYFLLEFGSNRGPWNPPFGVWVELLRFCERLLWASAELGCNRLPCCFLKLRVHVWFTNLIAFNLLSVSCFFCHFAPSYHVGLEGFHSPKGVDKVFEGKNRCLSNMDLFTHLFIFFLRRNDLNLGIATLHCVKTHSVSSLKRCDAFLQWVCESCWGVTDWHMH